MQTIDFTQALYLGFKHAHHQLSPWRQLTLGTPAVLNELPTAVVLAKKIAQLQGLQAGVLAPSTLHLFQDVFDLFPNNQYAIFYDRDLYALGKWGIERAKGQGKKVYPFAHFRTTYLARKIRATPFQPIIVTDGWCPKCGQLAPLKDYLQLAKARKGWVLIDDTQSFGILGKNPSPYQPLGQEGGGILQYLNLKNVQRVLTINSLAKGWGVPIAALSASPNLIQKYRKISSTRWHCSPISVADVSALAHAYQQNHLLGERLRKRLIRNISFFQKGLGQMGFRINEHFFPIQTLESRHSPLMLHQYLAKQGVKTLLLTTHQKDRPVLTLIIRANHTLRVLKQTLCIIQRFVKERHFSAHQKTKILCKPY